jgi:N-acetylglucosaminyl-diphospho-decaprenol L-rhamnosyltransferase
MQNAEHGTDKRVALSQPSLDLSIIVVNWNSAEFVRRCVDSIRAQTTGLTYEIIVADNASFDGCDRVLQEHAPYATYIQCEKNLGFAKANNHAFQRSRGASILFLNPDTEILGPAICLLYRVLQELPGAGAVGARLLNRDASLQTSCIQSFPTILNQALDCEYFRKQWPKSALWGTRAFLNDHLRPQEVQAISGACLMLKRETFERVGAFNEDYFMYSEDIDLCYKVQRAGYKNYYVPEAEVIHFGGNSSKQAPSNFSSVMMRESTMRFLRNTRGDLYGMGYRLAMLVSAVCRVGLLSISWLTRWSHVRRRLARASLRKWLAILRWSVKRADSLNSYLAVGRAFDAEDGGKTWNSNCLGEA